MLLLRWKESRDLQTWIYPGTRAGEERGRLGAEKSWNNPNEELSFLEKCIQHSGSCNTISEARRSPEALRLWRAMGISTLKRGKYSMINVCHLTRTCLLKNGWDSGSRLQSRLKRQKEQGGLIAMVYNSWQIPWVIFMIIDGLVSRNTDEGSSGAFIAPKEFMNGVGWMVLHQKS